jgi:hypothetical protein
MNIMSLEVTATPSTLNIYQKFYKYGGRANFLSGSTNSMEQSSVQNMVVAQLV